jgi:hypothetical protein
MPAFARFRLIKTAWNCESAWIPHLLRIVQVSGTGGEARVAIAIAMVSSPWITGDHRDVTDLPLPNRDGPNKKAFPILAASYLGIKTPQRTLCFSDHSPSNFASAVDRLSTFISPTNPFVFFDHLLLHYPRLGRFPALSSRFAVGHPITRFLDASKC